VDREAHASDEETVTDHPGKLRKVKESLDPEAQRKVDEAWAAEIERRCAAVDAGTLGTSDWKDVRARIERDIFGRVTGGPSLRSG
jgi:putative addiction module component (TIGR02574 family)